LSAKGFGMGLEWSMASLAPAVGAHGGVTPRPALR